MRIPLTALVLLLGLDRAAEGHDLWLIPPDRGGPGMPLLIRAHSGMNFPESEQAPDTDKFTARFMVRPNGTRLDLTAAGKQDKSGLLRGEAAAAGVYLVAVQTAPRILTLEAGQFNDYLVADGLPHIYRLRAKEGMLHEAGKERYSKSPKALFRVGQGGAGDPCRVLGLPLEIVPLRDPFQLKPGDTLPVRVLFQEKPLADANLGWDLPHDGDAPSGTVRTNAKGEALVPIAQTGLITIRLTHMTRPKTAEYEWESFWTTLTFWIPEAGR